MVEGEMRAGAARAAIDLEDVLPFDGFDVLRHEIFARALVVEATGQRACILSLEVTSIAPALLTNLREVIKEVASCDGAFSWVVPTHTFSVPHVRTPGHLADDAARDCNERYRTALVGAARASGCGHSARYACHCGGLLPRKRQPRRRDAGRLVAGSGSRGVF